MPLLQNCLSLSDVIIWGTWRGSYPPHLTTSKCHCGDRTSIAGSQSPTCGYRANNISKDTKWRIDGLTSLTELVEMMRDWRGEGAEKLLCLEATKLALITIHLPPRKCCHNELFHNYKTELKRHLPLQSNRQQHLPQEQDCRGENTDREKESETITEMGRETNGEADTHPAVRMYQ